MNEWCSGTDGNADGEEGCFAAHWNRKKGKRNPNFRDLRFCGAAAFNHSCNTLSLIFPRASCSPAARTVLQGIRRQNNLASHKSFGTCQRRKRKPIRHTHTNGASRCWLPLIALVCPSRFSAYWARTVTVAYRKCRGSTNFDCKCSRLLDKIRSCSDVRP